MRVTFYLMNMPAAPGMPSIFAPKPVRVWIVIGLFAIYLTTCFGIFFGAIHPVADFSVQPSIEADSGTYWIAAGIRPATVSGADYSLDATTNLFGPVIQAEIFRTELNVALCNCAILILCLWLLGSMREFDRSMFILLLMANPLLIQTLITLNKEIFALAGIILFVRYTSVHRFRLVYLSLALAFSLMARWQQTFVMLIFVALQSRLSPIRKRPLLAVLTVLCAFTVGYALINQLVPAYFAVLLAQAEAGHTILLMDNIQAHFGFPAVVIPKILMNVMGRFTTPYYFFSSYWEEDFSNWRDQIFMVLHTLLTTLLLLFLFLSKRLRLQHAPVLLLAYYLMMTAVNPMVQSRYEYSAYVLLCLEGSRYFHIRRSNQTSEQNVRTMHSLEPRT